MRAPPFPPDQMPPNVRALHDDMAEIADRQNAYVSKRDNGALVGPFAPMLRFPKFGVTAWAYTKELLENSTLPKPAKEVAILATGATFNSRYELYAHERVAAHVGLSDAKIAALAAGQRPADLTREEQAAYDVAVALTAGKQLPESTYQRAVQVFGDEQTAELIYLVGGYALISMLLNAYDVSVPGQEDRLPHG
ncbi:carboxymuconolactone decarboxylase family protein [Sphingomonas morindae]|uniref:Carboxymuconolactone decarboxylase family protein n=1 Tax=Sphingomonas morindae TaxID=1541170 RepID=A0ABY4XAJ4_9SPHN|nr:carboxymuconolactone decarboxylase family protein [Sphingomonas morindae]USI73919.1 carboxymuconolactone decarboxylase family protein [Sphingomonas morindae]